MPIVYYSRRSRHAPNHVADQDIDQRNPKNSWPLLAREKGYDYFGRDRRDRGTVYLRCMSCCAIMAVHTHVLRSAQPECTSCYLSDVAKEATAAGLEFVKPCPDDSHRAFYRAPCGHEVSRQRGRIQMIASGRASLRCEVCLEERYAGEAQAQGWTLLSAASDGKLGYRRYRHDCGHEQDVSVGNMLSGRFSCNSCSPNWSAEPSYVYLDVFELPEGRGDYLKIGMSRRPLSRLLHQFALADGIRAEVLEKVQLNTGGVALREEKRMHKVLKQQRPEWVVGASELDWIGVSSEIYRIEALPFIRELFAELKTRSTS